MPTIQIEQLRFLAFQSNPMIGIDPTPFTAWGVLGLLAVALFVFLGVIWKLFTKSTNAMEAQTQVLIEFVDRHRAEHNRELRELSEKNNQSIATVTDKVVVSQDRMTSAFAKVARMIDELVMLERVYDRASRRPAGSTPLTDDEIERFVRQIRSNNKEKE